MQTVSISVRVRTATDVKAGGLWLDNVPDYWEGKYLEIRCVNEEIASRGDAVVM